MEVLQRIQAILRAADRSLAELAAECMGSRDFDGATACIEAARRLSALLTPADGEALPPASPAATETPAGEALRGQKPPPTQLAARTTRVRKGDYPKFVRDGDSLVKIGWSKSDKSEYEHKSPKEVLSYLIPAIAKAGASGKRFSMDKLLPLKEDDGAEVPGYQAYLCLAWLRSSGLVQQHGRQGYTVPKKTDLAAAVEGAWEKLSNR
jgi:hypothetical protein